MEKEYFIIKVSCFYNDMNYADDFKVRFDTIEEVETYVETVLKNTQENVDYDWKVEKVVVIDEGKSHSKIGMHEVKDKRDLPWYDGTYIFFYKDGTSEEVFIDIDDNDDYTSFSAEPIEDIIGWREA